MTFQNKRKMGKKNGKEGKKRAAKMTRYDWSIGPPNKNTGMWFGLMEKVWGGIWGGALL